jgi:ubiquinone/menaquinone biosynthesis C-methylase UbiE
MSFEKEYYEDPSFWSGAMIEDEANKIRINSTINLIPNDVTSILDVGCGNGKFLKEISNMNKNIKLIGVDRSEEALGHVNAEKVVAEINDLPFKSETIDCVSCLEVLEHIHDPYYNNALKELARVSKKYVLIGVPFNENLQLASTKCPVCSATFNRDLHMRTYTEEFLKNMMTEHGYKLIELKNVVKSTELIGIRSILKFKNLFTKKKETIFQSPICIVCGYKNLNFDASKYLIESDSKGNLEVTNKGLKSLIKSIWPKKETPGYWAIALYERCSK